jgi:hypothetical protein
MKNLNRIRNLLNNKIKETIRKGELFYASTKEAGSIAVFSAKVCRGELLLETRCGWLEMDLATKFRTEKAS